MLFWLNLWVFSISVLLQVLLPLLPCCLSFRLFCYALLVGIFYSKMLSIPCIILLVCLHTCFVCIILLFLDIFLIFLLSPVGSGLFPRDILLFFLILFFFFVPTYSSVFSLYYHFFHVVVYFLSVFPVKLIIKNLIFYLCSSNPPEANNVCEWVHTQNRELTEKCALNDTDLWSAQN